MGRCDPFAQEADESLGRRCQRNAASPDERDRPGQAPPGDVEDDESSGLQFDLEREMADGGDARAFRDGSLHRLPRRQLDRSDGMQAHLPAGGLDGGARCGPLRARDPRQALEILRPQSPPAERRGADQHDLVVEQGLAVQLGRRLEPPDDRDLGLVRPNPGKRLGRGRDVELELDSRIAVAELEQNVRQQVCPRNPRRRERQRAGLGLGPGAERALRVREQRLRAQHVVGEQLAGRRERRAGPAARNERLADLRFERGEVLRDRRLADVKLRGRA
ncbi:MAG TPA: hypothetical protein VKA45_09150 [Gaiellaceae bacterium]|nr:hypothetical protein [Gaiellaceae bacterium]